MFSENGNSDLFTIHYKRYEMESTLRTFKKYPLIDPSNKK